ncbi:MAG TPA: glycerol-3-phosphate 1-O-acyltransferase PlsY [Steroidobacteraceae bacterium]|nr:glycerol-3-phosphate 1-O-acyltransferase PlsY [Steroidobacteraceae bacterium]
MVELGFKTLIAYLLGSVIGSLLFGRLRGVDIRTQGSGNAGGTNALRTQGWAFALGVIVVDVGKALLAVGWLPSADLPGLHPDPSVDRDWLTVACATAVVVGHVYPVWHEFRGGKGAATLVGTVLVLAPVALVPIVAVWLLTVMLTGYVGLGTMLGSATLPVYLAVASPERTPLVVYGVLMSVFIVYTHRSNVRRMRAGSENRARRLWLLRPRG